MGIRNVDGIISKKQEGPRRSDFQGVRMLPMPSLKNFSEKALLGEKSNTVAKISIFAKMTIVWPRTPSFWPGQSSLAPPVHLAGGRGAYKNKVWLQEKQTVVGPHTIGSSCWFDG